MSNGEEHTLGAQSVGLDGYVGLLLRLSCFC
jgi:hypothetical protein